MGTFNRKAFIDALSKRDGITPDDIAKAINSLSLRPGTTAKDVRNRLRSMVTDRVGRGGSWEFDAEAAADLAEQVVTRSAGKGRTIKVTASASELNKATTTITVE